MPAAAWAAHPGGGSSRYLSLVIGLISLAVIVYCVVDEVREKRRERRRRLAPADQADHRR